MSDICCPQCGFHCEVLHEGYCRECCEENQKQLDDFNWQKEYWDSLNGEEREKRIRFEL